MLDISRSHFSLVLSKDVTTGSTVSVEGACLVRTLESGVEKVAMSAGASGEIFAGFSITNNESVDTEVFVETVTMSADVGGDCTAQLTHGLLVGTTPAVEIRVLGIGAAGVDGTQVANVGLVDTDPEFFVNATTGLLTLDNTWASTAVTVHYRYNLTALQSRQKFFEKSPNNTASAQLAQVGVGGGQGQIFTQNFDTAINFDDVAGVPVVLKSGPAGKITVGGSGATLTGFRVVKTPTATDPFLGVSFSAVI